MPLDRCWQWPALAPREKYFITYRVSKYEGPDYVEYETLDEVIDFLTRGAPNPDFWFEVIQGHKMEFEPAEFIKSFKVKERP